MQPPPARRPARGPARRPARPTDPVFNPSKCIIIPSHSELKDSSQVNHNHDLAAIAVTVNKPVLIYIINRFKSTSKDPEYLVQLVDASLVDTVIKNGNLPTWEVVQSNQTKLQHICIQRSPYQSVNLSEEELLSDIEKSYENIASIYRLKSKEQLEHAIKNGILLQSVNLIVRVANLNLQLPDEPQHQTLYEYSLRLHNRLWDNMSSLATKNRSKDTSLHIFHHNLKSLYKKIHYYQSLNLAKLRRYFLCFRTWLKPQLPDQTISLLGFNLDRCDRKSATKTSGGGAALYINSYYNFTESSRPQSKLRKLCDTVWVDIKMHQNSSDPLKVASIYLQPDFD